MMQMSVDELRPGVVLHEGLFSSYGARLLPRGAVVTEEVCESLRRSKQGVVFVPGAGVEAPEEETGTEAERGLRNWLRGLGLDATATRRARGAVRRTAEGVVAGMMGRWEGMTRRVEPAPAVFRAVLEETLAEGRLPRVLPEAGALASERRERVVIVRRVLDRMAEGGGEGGRPSAGAASDLVEEMIDRLGRGAAVYGYWVMASPRGGDWLAEHAYTVMALSVGMGAHLGWSREDVRAAGLAGLLADVGMVLAPDAALTGGRSLDEMEVNGVRRHCTISGAVLARMEDVPACVALAAYQHHELLDGSGYPAGARGERVCDLARVVAVAGAFAAGCAGRAHRAGRAPAAVMREIMRSARGARHPGGGKFDARVVRALVRVVGVWPAGSVVELSNGLAGVVVGVRDVERPQRPVVRVIGRGGVGGGEVVDLSEGRWKGVGVVGEVENGHMAKGQRARSGGVGEGYGERRMNGDGD